MPSPSRNLDTRRSSRRQAMPATGTTTLLVTLVAAVAALNAGLVCCQESQASSLSARASSSSSSSSQQANGQSISTVVATPALLAPGDAFTLTWAYTSGDEAEAKTTGDLKAFDIDLEHCPDGAGTCECTGASLVSLCPGGGGCIDSDGSYDLVLPSDVDAATSAVSGQVYQVRVSLASNPSVFSCGYGFKVQEAATADEEGPHLADTTTTSDGGGGGGSSGGTNPATLTAIAPTEVLVPGQAFTARWVYDSGLVGEDGGVEAAGGEFAVDLFSCAGGACDDGSCGEFVVALCGQDGCYDPGTGDYDVVVPADTTPGAYSLYVEELGENGPWDCVQFDVSVDPLAPSPAPSPEALPPTSAPATAPTTSPITPPPPLTTAPTVPGAVPTTKPTAAPKTPKPTATPVAREPGSPGVPPTPVPAKQVCDPGAALSYMYEDQGDAGHLVTVAHASGNRTDLGCVTMTALWEWLQTGPAGVPVGLLYPVDAITNTANLGAASAADLTGVWLLRTSIDVTNGVTMEMIGTSAGGDCDELRIRSSSTLSHALRGYGGNLDIFKTHIQSWKESSNSPHTFSSGSKGDESRSYIACVSEVVNPSDSCGNGAAKNDMGECRMDMVDSELGYLGYFGTEAYGITWKVRGFCTDKSNLELFDNVNVYGDIMNCDIHHMWYGMYSYGHQGGVWINNLMHDNHVYGFDPHDDSDYLTIHNNTVWNNAKHGIIASKRCNNVSVRNNTVDASGGSGIMLHRSCDDSEIIGNIVHGSADAGIALVETSRTIVTENVIADGKWGARLTLGATDNQIFNNLFDNNDQRDIYAYEGADEPEVFPYTGVNVGNVFDSNTINYVASTPVNLEDSDDTVISNNVFTGTGGHFEFDNAHETSIFGNEGEIIVSDEHQVHGGSCFAATTGGPFDPTC